MRRAISPSFSSNATELELRAIQHFQIQTVPALSASFDSDFWNAVVLQVSSSELPVRSAVIAFSSLHQCYESHGRGTAHTSAPNQANEIRRYGLTHYNVAVRRTVQLLDIRDPTSCNIALISCLLFVCLELIQDNYAASITHLTGGLRLLSCFENAQRERPLLPSISALNDQLKQFFCRIIVQSLFLGDTHYAVGVIPKLIEVEPSTAFSSVAEARDLLDSIFLSSYGFLQPIYANSYDSYEVEKLRQTQLLNRLQNWYGLFREFVQATQGQLNTKNSAGVILLEIHYVSLVIMLDTALDKSKTFWSAPTSPFLRIISLVESLLSQPDLSKQALGEPLVSKLPRYSFDLGVIGPLFYTIVKCWNPLIRSQALSLLHHPNIPHREGMWSAEAAATIAERIIDVEEDLVRNTRNLNVDSETAKTDDDVVSETIKQKIWFDIERPMEDDQKLKIFVGAKPDKKRDERERREEVVTW
jgi:hypothetical protein